MSSISAKIAVINKAQPGELSQLLESINETMQTTKLSEKVTSELCQAVIPIINKDASSSVCCSAISIVKNVIKSNKYPEDFPRLLLLQLKNAMGHHKKNPRNDALNAANDLLPILKPEAFWEIMSDALTDKNNYLKESALILFRQTLITFPTFKVKNYLKPVFSNFKDPQEVPRKHAYLIAQTLYLRNPTAVEKLLRNQFSLEANPIIETLKNDGQSSTNSVSSKSSKSSRFAATASYSAAMSVPKVESNDEIEEAIINQFNELSPDAEPDANACPFKRLETMLKKSADWQDRMEGLKILLSHARGCTNQAAFLRDMRSIQDQYSDCLSDQRSALMKYACIVLVGLAKVFGSQLDIHSDWLISSILPKTSHGTFVISKTAEIAIVKYVQQVQGKHIKSILLRNADNLSQDVRVTVIRAMIVARRFWTQQMSAQFEEIIKTKTKSEKYKEVREAAAAGIDGIKYIDFNEEIRQPQSAVKKSKIPLRSTKAESVKSEDVDFDQDVLDFDQESVGKEDEFDAPDNEEGQENDGTVKEGDEEGGKDNFVSESLSHLFESKNTKELLEFIQREKPDLSGYMSDVVELIALDINESEGTSDGANLLKEICDNYVKSLSPYISRIIIDLPEDTHCGMQCLVYLANAFGELPIAKFLRSSNLSYASDFILRVAEKLPDDIDFQSEAVLKAVNNQQYEKHHLQIFEIIKNIYEKNPSKCEYLFSSMPAKEREEILEEYKLQLPSLYQEFYNDKRNDFPALLSQEIERVKSGKKINFELIEEVPKNDVSLLLLAIAAIRESPEFDPRCVEYLINLTENYEPVTSGAVNVALQQRYESDPSCCLTIANNFIPTNNAFNSFARSIKFASKNDTVEAMMILKDYLVDGLSNIKTKYAVLAVLANAVKFIGEEYRDFCGKLSFCNIDLLNNMIEKLNNTVQ